MKLIVLEYSNTPTAMATGHSLALSINSLLDKDGLLGKDADAIFHWVFGERYDVDCTFVIKKLDGISSF